MPENNESEKKNERLITTIQKLINLVLILVAFIVFLVWVIIWKPDFTDVFHEENTSKIEPYVENLENDSLNDLMDTFWTPADISTIKNKELLAKVEYGKELISHTAKYLGPKGSVMQISNGMNCQNCHLNAGTKPWGNNYGSVKSTYPKYRARSGKEEDIYKRINDCFERSLNGKALNLKSKEMQSIKAYIEYIGKKVPKGEKAIASGIFELPVMDRAADPLKGNAIYIAKCASCHQVSGQGMLDPDKVEYMYPPLWGKNSYNIGAGLYRMGRFAGYIKFNMPLGVSFPNAQLTDEEAWDIAAYVNSQQRPDKDLSMDWPKKEEKPFDHPFGPFTDKYSEQQHKYGPFKPIMAVKKKTEKAKK